MEQWSILGNVITYIHYNKHPKNFHNMSIRVVHKEKSKWKSNLEEWERHSSDLDFGDAPGKLKGEYLDMYKGIQSEILSTSRFDENSDLSTTYLGRADLIKDSKIKAEESFPISEQEYTMGKLLDGTECQVLLDRGASKSFMFKSHYLCYKSLHSLPKLASRTWRIQIQNGQFVSVLFIIPIVIDIHRHRFEIYTLVSEIHENIDLVLGIINIFWAWGCHKFLRLLLQFPKQIPTNFSTWMHSAKAKRT